MILQLQGLFTLIVCIGLYGCGQTGGGTARGTGSPSPSTNSNNSSGDSSDSDDSGTETTGGDDSGTTNTNVDGDGVGANNDLFLDAADGAKVFAKLSEAKEGNKKIVVLFHQANGNTSEYEPIAPRISSKGYDTLSIDARAGGNGFNGTNKTREKLESLPNEGEYQAARQDLEAAIDYAKTNGYTDIVAFGSSYSATLTLLMASSNKKDDLTAIGVFSPGNYGDLTITNADIAKIGVPVFLTYTEEEKNSVSVFAGSLNAGLVTELSTPTQKHGASTFRQDQNGALGAEHLDELLDWLESL